MEPNFLTVYLEQIILTSIWLPPDSIKIISHVEDAGKRMQPDNDEYIQ